MKCHITVIMVTKVTTADGKNYSDYNSSFLCDLGDGQLQCEYGSTE